MSRVILHVDANSFYASVECLYRPALRGRPLSVCGDPEARHGIVLASTMEAKKCGVKTGMALWQARQVCPELVMVPARFQLYMHFSQMMREIESCYSDRVEAFGLDENWMDLSQPGMTLEKGTEIAHEICQRVREELGITVSVGVSYNKVLAKLGSDMKKPDAVTVLPPEQLRALVWPLPVSDLLYVGPRTTAKLRPLGVTTIGGLACLPSEVLKRKLGKNGLMIQAFALGLDDTPVRPCGVEEAIKSVGNSCTAPHDIRDAEEAKCVCCLLVESVSARLREHGFRTSCVSLSARTAALDISSCQMRLARATDVTDEIAAAAYHLVEKHCPGLYPLRSLGVCCSALSLPWAPEQMDLFGDFQRREKQRLADTAVDELRRRFGHQVVQRGRALTDLSFTRVNPREEHLIHPVGFLRG